MSKSDQVYAYTASKIKYLQSIADTGSGKGFLAELRHGIGKNPGELPSLWCIIFDGMPEELLGKSGSSYAEQAVYTALTLYALHQQGNSESMNRPDISIGKAAYHIAKNEDDEQRIINRLNLVVTAVSADDASRQLRGLVQLLKSESVPLDYALLAKQLYLFNYPDSAAEIKLSWGRDFYYEKFNKFKSKESN